MSQPRTRHTPYGRPLPTLLEPPVSSRHADLPQNQHMRAYVIALLDDTLAEVLHPGVRCHITLQLTVVDGRLQPSVDCTTTQHYRLEQEGR